MSAPRATIVVAIYNIEDYLLQCLNSLVRQSYQNLDIILIDDGSTDGSGKICDDFLKNFKASNQSKDKKTTIRVIHQQNQGLSAVRNNGLKHARADFIAFVDGDDYLEPDYIEKMVDAFADDVDIVVCGYHEQGKNVLPPAQTKKLSGEEAAAQLLVGQENLDIVAWNKLYRTSLFRKNKIKYPVGIKHEDSLTTYKLYAHAAHVRYLAVPLYHYRHRASSIMANTSRLEALKTREQAARGAIEYFETYPTGELKSAAEVSLLTAKFAFVDSALRGEIDRQYTKTTLNWLRQHAKSYSDNQYLTAKLQLYLKLVRLHLYGLFRKIKN